MTLSNSSDYPELEPLPCPDESGLFRAPINALGGPHLRLAFNVLACASDIEIVPHLVYRTRLVIVVLPHHEVGAGAVNDLMPMALFAEYEGDRHLTFVDMIDSALDLKRFWSLRRLWRYLGPQLERNDARRSPTKIKGRILIMFSSTGSEKRFPVLNSLISMVAGIYLAFIAPIDKLSN